MRNEQSIKNFRTDKKNVINKKRFPCVGKIIIDENDVCISCRDVTIKSDCYLDDHRFNSKPLFPGVMALEYFAELAHYLYPNQEIVSFDKVSFRKAIKFDETVATEIEAKVEKEETHAVISLTKKSSSSKKVSNWNMKGEVKFGEKIKKKQSLPELLDMPLLTGDYLYKVLPHGQTFHVLSEINRVNNEVIAVGDFKQRKFFSWEHEPLHSKPLLIEAGFQSTGVLDFVLAGRTSLPSEIESLTFYTFKGTPYFIIGQKKRQDEKGSLFDFQVLTKKGEVVLEAINYRTILMDLGETDKILKKIRSHRVRQLFQIPKKSWLEVIDRSLFKEKLSKEPTYPEEWLTSDERETIEDMEENEQELFITKLFAMKRVLKLMFRKKNLQNLPLKDNSLGNYYHSRLFRRVDFSLVVTEKYVLAMGSLKKRTGIALIKNNKQDLPKKEELLHHKNLKWFNIRAKNNHDEYVKNILVAKKALQKKITERYAISFQAIKLENYQDNELRFSLIKNYIPKNFSEKIHNKFFKQKFTCNISKNEKYHSAICY
ncbi:MAG: polyketide synthase dehydratase domain-containing protein [Asgard group archaeon]|nr:polyketide synthase dehydratase domain-containing protein [Asgard group archaeon]